VAVGVANVDRAERAAVEHVGALDPPLAQIVAPRLLLFRALHAEREVVRRADADHARRKLRVLHEAQVAVAVAAVEPHVTGFGVVIRGSVVHDRQAERVAVERDGALEVAADRGDVVHPTQPHALVV
jgi:hypothetical protein